MTVQVTQRSCDGNGGELLRQRPSRQDRIEVLMVGPVDESGGITAVARALVEGADAIPDIAEFKMLDSGGGHGCRTYPRFAVALATALTKHYDVMHLHVASGGSTIRKSLLATCARIRGIPYIIHLHGAHYLSFLESRGRIGLRIIRQFFASAYRVVVLGDYWREQISDHLGLPSQSFTVVRNGVVRITPGEGTSKFDDPYLIFVGLINHRKGVDLLLQTMDQLLSRPEFEHWRCLLVGPIPDSRVLEPLSSMKASVAARITPVGPKHGEEKNSLLRRASIFVLPSRAEGLPMALLEAMAAGLPVVVSDVGAVREVVVNGVNGMIVQPGSSEDLTGVVHALMRNTGLRHELATNAYRTFVESFTNDAMTEAIVQVWRDAVRGRANE